MQTTDHLVEEHCVILRMLVCLERLIEQGQRNDALDASSAAQLLAFFEFYADGFHQEKEERVLFPKLLRRANPRQAATVDKLFGDHGMERRKLGTMRSNLMGATHAEPICLDVFLRSARDYLSLQLAHLSWENVVLLPMADRILTTQDDGEIMAGFRAIDSARPQDFQQTMIEMGDDLCCHFDVDASDADLLLSLYA